MLDWIEIINSNNDFHLRIPKTSPRMLSLEAAELTIKQIQKNYSPPYHLYLSGGVDSQAMLYSWKMFGYNYNPVSIIYNQDLNDHDLTTLRKFALINDIKISFIDFDVIHFLENEYIDYVDNFRCGSPHICTYMKISELVKDGTVIFSGEYQRPKYPHFIDRNNWGLYKYVKKTGRSLIPYFFQETKQLCWSFSTPITPTKKSDVYQFNGFPVIPQTGKITGFEKVKDYYDTFSYNFSPQEKIERITNQFSTRNFDILFRNKYEYKYRQDKFVVEFYDEP